MLMRQIPKHCFSTMIIMRPTPAKRDRIYNMVKSMKAEGIPISGIGMQGHYNTLSPTEDEFRKAIELYSGQVVDNIHI